MSSLPAKGGIGIPLHVRKRDRDRDRDRDMDRDKTETETETETDTNGPGINPAAEERRLSRPVDAMGFSPIQLAVCHEGKPFVRRASLPPWSFYRGEDSRAGT